jgi:hypothetical protein
MLGVHKRLHAERRYTYLGLWRSANASGEAQAIRWLELLVGMQVETFLFVSKGLMMR